MVREALGTASAEDGGATARLTRALEAIGWRGGDSVDAAEVAQEVLPSIASCARDHGNVGTMYREIAEVLRGNGPALDGSLPPVHDYIPAAAEVVRRFIASDG
jgi:uncharacterized iron-regulated protein